MTSQHQQPGLNANSNDEFNFVQIKLCANDVKLDRMKRTRTRYNNDGGKNQRELNNVKHSVKHFCFVATTL